MMVKRPPPHLRKKLDIGYRIDGQSIEIFEIRPDWQGASVILEHSVEKTAYVYTQKAWKIFWQRADLKWHGYEPMASVKSIEEFFDAYVDDPHGCFSG